MPVQPRACFLWWCWASCVVVVAQTGRALLNVSITSAGATYVLPLGGGTGSQQGFNVDWSDGSGKAKCTNDGLPCQHTYSNAGFYVLKLTGRALGWSMLYAPGSRCHNLYPAVWTDRAGRSCAVVEGELRDGTPDGACTRFPRAWYAGLGGLSATEACCACGGGAAEPAEAAGTALVAILDRGRIELHPTAGRHLQNLAGLHTVAPLPAPTGLTSLYRSFSGLASLALDVGALDTSAVTTLAYAFAESRQLAVQGLSDCDVSTVTNLSFAFEDSAGSLFPGVEAWSTTSLLDATDAFNYATAFTADLGAWNVDSLQRWDFLLQGASAYTYGLAAWALRLPPATDRAGACLWAFAGTRVWEADRAALCGSDCVLTVFAEYDPAPRAPALSYLDPAVVTSLSAHTFTVDWGDGSPVQTCVQAPGVAACPKATGAYAVGTRAHVRIRGALHGLRHLGYGLLWPQAIHAWGNVSLTTAESSFEPSREWQTAKRNRLFYYGESSSLSYLSYLAPIRNTGALRYVDAFAWLLSGAEILTGDLRDWDVPPAGSLSFLLVDAYRLDQPLYWNTTAATSLYRTFSGAHSFNGDLSGWDVGRVTSLVSTFFDAWAFNCDISGWRVRADARTDYLLDFACSFKQNLSAWPVAVAVARC